MKAITVPIMKSRLRCAALSVGFFLVSGLSANAQVKILFDATKAEMAGNADWVIDADQTTLGVGASGTYTTSSGHQSNPQRIPTPAQSGITASTSETYWTGALSSWAVDCVKRGYQVETLPWNGLITYGIASNPQDLSNYKVFVVDEPNLKFSTSEKTAIVSFVQHGGSLFMISDHNNSDRNGDGWDSPNIWNDLLTTNSVQANPFGIAFDLADFSGSSTSIFASSSDSIVNGPMGSVTQVYWSSGTSMTLSTTANPTVKGVIFKSGSSAGSTNALVAYARYGSGKVAAIGDSSPFDDGTGNPTCTLYNGYITDAAGNHRLLIMNMTIWLADTTAVPSSTQQLEVSHEQVIVYPNPAHGEVSLLNTSLQNDVNIKFYNVAGQVVAEKSMQKLEKDEQVSFKMEPGFYIIKVESDKILQTSKIAVF